MLLEYRPHRDTSVQDGLGARTSVTAKHAMAAPASLPLPLPERDLKREPKREPKRRARRSSNPDFIPPSVIAACKTGDEAVVVQFLSVPSNLSKLDMHAEDTYTLLHVAAESSTAKVVELLLAHGASHRSMSDCAVLGQPRRRGLPRRAPLAVAGLPHTRRAAAPLGPCQIHRRCERPGPASPAFHCRPQTVDSHATVHCPVSATSQPVDHHSTVHCPLFVDRRTCLDVDGQTPLHVATAAGHIDVVRGLTRGECPELALLDNYRMTHFSKATHAPPGSASKL